MLLWYIETDLFCIEGVVVKRFFTLVCLVLCAFTLAVISFAHPGGTDGSGGHYNHDTGEYHYHHGYPEHQHPDGVCPYSYGDTTNESTTLFSLEDFTFEYKEFTPIVPEYPSIGDYTSPEEDTTEEETTDEPTEIDYNSHYNNTNDSYNRTTHNSSAFFRKIKYALSDFGVFIIKIITALMYAIIPGSIIPFVLTGVLGAISRKNISDNVFGWLAISIYIISAILIFMLLISL